jgi:hypothetical protein
VSGLPLVAQEANVGLAFVHPRGKLNSILTSEDGNGIGVISELVGVVCIAINAFCKPVPVGDRRANTPRAILIKLWPREMGDRFSRRSQFFLCWSELCGNEQG